jgi:hypothetical protein
VLDPGVYIQLSMYKWKPIVLYFVVLKTPFKHYCTVSLGSRHMIRFIFRCCHRTKACHLARQLLTSTMQQGPCIWNSSAASSKYCVLPVALHHCGWSDICWTSGWITRAITEPRGTMQAMPHSQVRAFFGYTKAATAPGIEARVITS